MEKPTPENVLRKHQKKKKKKTAVAKLNPIQRNDIEWQVFWYNVKWTQTQGHRYTKMYVYCIPIYRIHGKSEF